MKFHRTLRKKGRRPAARPKETSIRITVPGTCAVEDLGMALLQAVAHLEALRVSHATAINLYLTPVNSHGTPVAATRDGKPVKAIAVDTLPTPTLN